MNTIDGKNSNNGVETKHNQYNQQGQQIEGSGDMEDSGHVTTEYDETSMVEACYALLSLCGMQGKGRRDVDNAWEIAEEERDAIEGLFLFLCRYFCHPRYSRVLVASVFTKEVISVLVERLCAPQPVVRGGTRNLLLQLYAHQEEARLSIVDAIDDKLRAVVAERAVFDVLEDLLGLLRSILRGSSSPFPERLQRLLPEVLLPLYSLPSLPSFAPTLLNIVVGYISADDPPYVVLRKLISYISPSCAPAAPAILKAVQTILCFCPSESKPTKKGARVYTELDNDLTMAIMTRILDPFLCHRSTTFEAVIMTLNDIVLSRRLLALDPFLFASSINMLKAVADNQVDEVARVIAGNAGMILVDRYRREHPDFAEEGFRNDVLATMKCQEDRLSYYDNFWMSVTHTAAEAISTKQCGPVERGVYESFSYMLPLSPGTPKTFPHTCKTPNHVVPSPPS